MPSFYPKGVVCVVFQGLQKLTLLDFPGRMACTLFTGGCNLRCPFCHNAELVLHPKVEGVPEEEVLAFLASRKGKLDGICVTGGEPLLQAELPDFLRRVRELGFLIKIDTNGFFPDRLRELIDGGLCDYVAMDVKNSPASYAKTVGVENVDLSPVRQSVALLLEGRVDYEFRTTVVRELHSLQDMVELSEWIAGAKRYALQVFTDSGALLRPGLSPWDPQTMKQLLAAVRQAVPAAELRGM